MSIIISSLTYELLTITHLGLQMYRDSLVIFSVIDFCFTELWLENMFYDFDYVVLKKFFCGIVPGTWFFV